MNLFRSRQGKLAGCFEYGNETSGFQKMGTNYLLSVDLLVSRE
jgi:hypothetical protein